LNISGLKYIQDISMLNTVEVLNISNCCSIRSLTGLTALKELDMTGVDGVESGFEVFQQLTSLTIGKVIRFKRITQALEKTTALSSLTLYESNLPFHSFIQVKHLTLWDCNDFSKFPVTLTHLKSLEVK
jgi:hypothetical protein